MKDVLIKLFKEQDGWVRLVIGLIVAVYFVTKFYYKQEFMLSDHEKRISNVEKVAEMIPNVKESLARIEGALRIRR